MIRAFFPCAAICAFTLAVLAADAPPMKPLSIVYPKPGIIPTPKKQPPGIELWPTRPREPVMAPEGCKVLSRGRPVSSSDKAPINGNLALITDGDKETIDGCFVELAANKQWVQIDLGASCRLHCILLWQFFGDIRAYRDVIVQASDDVDFLDGVTTLYNNDRDNSSGMGIGADREYLEHYEGRLIPANGVKARYVRLHSNASTVDDSNRYVEVEVWGMP